MDLPQTIKMASFNHTKLMAIWEILRQFPSTFADGTKDPENFTARLLAEDSLVFEMEGGLILVEHIVPGLKAEFHATFWDHKLSPKAKDLEDLILWVFVQLKLERLETYVASYARAVRRFLVDRLGFTYEGTLRRAFRNNGQLYDLNMYSIIREEVFLWDRKTLK